MKSLARMSRTGSLRLCFAAGILLLAAFTAPVASGQDPTSLPAFPERQLWVPREQLDSVLDRFPRAVHVSRQEYNLLLAQAQDAIALRETHSPRPILVDHARFSTRLDDAVLHVETRLQLRSLINDWAELPLTLPGDLASVLVDGDNALRRESAPTPDGEARGTLLLRGKGAHDISFTFEVPVTSVPGGFAAEIPHPHLPAAFLRLGFKSAAAAGAASITTNGATRPAPSEAALDILFPASGAPLRLGWPAPVTRPPAPPAILQQVRYDIRLEPPLLVADCEITLRDETGPLPSTLSFALPDGLRVLDVHSEEVRRWEVSGKRLLVFPSARSTQSLTLLLRTESILPVTSGPAQSLLPLLRESQAFRVAGDLMVQAGPGWHLRLPDLPPQLRPVVPDLDTSDPDSGPGGVLAHYGFSHLPKAPVSIAFQRVTGSLRGFVDTLVEPAPSHLTLRRRISLYPLAAPLFETRLELPPGETLLELTPEPGSDLRCHFDADSVLLSWPAGLAPGASAAFHLTTERTVDAADESEPSRIQLASPALPPGTWSGSLGILEQPALAIGEVTASGLSPAADGPNSFPTDAPARFWTWESSFRFEADLIPTAAPLEALLLATARPLPGALLLEGRLQLSSPGAPRTRLDLLLPEDIASRFRVPAPEMASLTYLPQGRIRLVLAQPFQGSLSLPWSLTLPLDAPSPTANAISTFSVSLPSIRIPEARRFTGFWLIEEPPATTFAFDPSTLRDLPLQSIPTEALALAHHPVRAAFQFEVESPPLLIHGQIYPTNPRTGGLEVHAVHLHSVVGAGAADLHELQLDLASHPGHRHLDLQLPPDARLIEARRHNAATSSLSAYLKPDGSVRVDLPGEDAASLSLIYETPPQRWDRRGQIRLQPPVLPAASTVFASTWTLHLPEGFSFETFSTNLTPRFDHSPGVLLALLGRRLAPAFPATQSWLDRRSQSVSLRFPSLSSLPSGPSLPLPDAPPSLLVQSGQTFAFAGLAAPSSLTATYSSWSRQMRHAWFAIVGGMIAFWLFARDRPFLLGLFGIAFLTFLPFSALIAPGFTPLVNALLIGWLLALALRLCWMAAISTEEKLSGPPTLTL